MDEYKHYTDWDDSIYGTGPTNPPKSRGGMVALMLIVIIFLCGIIAFLGIMNIRLFSQLKIREEQELSISHMAEVATTAPAAETEAVPVPLQEEPMAVAEPLAPMDLQQSPPSVANVPEAGAMSLQDIYLHNIGSVVSIICNRAGSSSTGTGVILSENGYIVTNAHVVEGAVSISVQLTDDRQFYAALVGSDEVTDLAVLRIETQDLTPARFGDSAQLRVGDTVVAIGDPLGVEFRGTYTNGIVSAINRDVEMDGRVMTLIQTNAALNSGNSGGPLINCYGQVIGINTMKIGSFAHSSGVEGLGFAIPSATVKDVVEQLVLQGYVSGRPTLGIQGEALSTFYQHYYRMPAGLYITHVDYGSDAHSVGITEGDLLLSIGTTRITSYDELRAAILGYQVGDVVEVVIYRGGQQYRVELTLSESKG